MFDGTTHRRDSVQWSSQDSVDTPSPRFLGRFELLWAHAA